MSTHAQHEAVRPELVVRRIPFEFPDDLEPRWNPAKVEWSYMVDGASLAMPYLEPYLIRSVRMALDQIEDPELRAEADDYCAQEGQHFRQHRRFNDLLVAKGYRELRDVEAKMDREYQGFLARRSLRFRLTYAAGFESMALAVGHWLSYELELLVCGSDARVASLILWHFVEEIEHKRTAFDVYQAVVGSYPLRVFGVFFASFHVMARSRDAYRAMLVRDGLWRNLASRRRLWRMVGYFLRRVLPHMVRCCSPRHDPRAIEDPQWITDWIDAYRRGDGSVPLLDTRHLETIR
ncbi:MAG: metal-dependent hydrolase [Myxococcales bacterium]|nr:MAG: metal-dependent hydrolase [Myxococcales bacterium]